MAIPWKAYPQLGQYLAVEHDNTRNADVIIACPMMADGSRSSDEEICQVDEEDTLYKDLFKMPDYDFSEQDDWRQALREEIQSQRG